MSDSKIGGTASRGAWPGWLGRAVLVGGCLLVCITVFVGGYLAAMTTCAPVVNPSSAGLLRIIDTEGRGEFCIVFSDAGPELRLVAPGGIATIRLGFESGNVSDLPAGEGLPPVVAFVRTDVSAGGESVSSGEWLISQESNKLMLSIREDGRVAYAGLGLSAFVDSVAVSEERDVESSGPTAEMYLATVDSAGKSVEGAIRAIASPVAVSITGRLDDYQRLGMYLAFRRFS